MQYLSKNLVFVFMMAFAVFLLAITFSIDKPLTLDEAVPTVLNAHIMSHSGVSMLGERVKDGSNETVLEIGHPPLYHILLALFFYLFGETEVCARMLGVVCLLLTMGVLLKIAQQVYEVEKSWSIWLIAVSIMAMNPYIQQHALLLDMDNSILTLFMTGTIYFFFRYLRIKSKWYLAITGLALGASFWAKEITPPILIASIFIFLWLREGFKQAFLSTSIMAVIGIGSFWLTWWAFCELTNVPLMSFIEFTFLRKGMHSPPFSYPFVPVIVFVAMILWLSLPLFILFALSLIERIKDFKNFRLFKPVDFLLIYVGLMLVYTVIYLPSASNVKLLKYAYPMVPILVLINSEYICKIFNRITAKHNLILFIVSALVLVFYLVWNLEDVLILLYSGALSSLAKAGILFFAPLAFVIIFLKLFRPSMTWVHRFAYASILCLMPMNIYIVAKQMSDYTTSLSWSNYGEKGFSQTVDYLASQLKPEDKIILRKDLGYYLNMRPGFEQLQWFYPVFRGGFDEMRNQFDTINHFQPIAFIVLEKYSNPSAAAEIIQPYFNLDQEIGDFQIYRRKD